MLRLLCVRFADIARLTGIENRLRNANFSMEGSRDYYVVRNRGFSASVVIIHRASNFPLDLPTAARNTSLFRQKYRTAREKKCYCINEIGRQCRKNRVSLLGPTAATLWKLIHGKGATRLAQPHFPPSVKNDGQTED